MVPQTMPVSASSRTRGFVANLSAKQIDARLRQAAEAFRRSERNLVVWLAELEHRRLYRELGFSSIHQYARAQLGFSDNLTYRLLALARELEHLPRLRTSVAKGEIGWTKAQELVKVVGVENEEAWIEEAKRIGRRDLRRRVVLAKRAAAARRKGNGGQQELDPSAGPPPPAPPLDRAPTTVTYRFTPTQLARFEAQMEKIHKMRLVAPSTSKEVILLEALEALIEAPSARSSEVETAASEDSSAEAAASGSSSAQVAGSARARGGVDLRRRKSTSPYQIIITRCESCGRGTVETHHGTKEITRAELEAASCDAVIHKDGERSRAAVPESTRWEVFTRDRHRCRALGCRHTRFLEIHHLVPRDQGGTNQIDNLVTLCSSCHRLCHEHGWSKRMLRGVDPPG